MTYETLNKNNLIPDLFRNVQRIGLAGILDGIESDLFLDFQNLKIIDLAISNLRELFHQGNKWMNYLNLNLSISNRSGRVQFENRLIIEFAYLKRSVSFDSIYEYPNEDLCLFKDFPHERLVYPIIVPGKRLECTCTLYWLQSKAHYYENEINIIFDYGLNYQQYNDKNSLEKTFLFCDESFNSTQCNFDAKFRTCHIQEDFNGALAHKLLNLDNDFDILYAFKFLQFILLVILLPIFCFIGIVNNVLSILVIRNKNNKNEFQEPMYKHIIINAVFNIIFCLIMCLKLINTCIFYGPSVFCSSVYQEIWAQNLKIILIHFLGSVTKNCANFSYLMFSISRLILITKQKESNISTKSKAFRNAIYVFTLVLVSSILCSFKLFQYRIKQYLTPFNAYKEFPFEIRDENYCYSETHKLQCKLFNTFKIANRSLNDVLFVILNILIDLILLVKYKHHMNRKLKQINDVAQRKVIHKSKKNVNRMILVNSLIYIFSHLPEFMMTLLLFVYSTKMKSFCNNKFSCDFLNEEAEFFGLISIVSQFYVFKIYDKNFKKSFSQIYSNFGKFFR
jgi:hypothetical protein